MQLLLIEDDGFKRVQIERYLNYLGIRDISHSYSFNSAKRSIKNSKFDFIVMDMSLPTSDVSIEDTGGIPQTFGGKRLLRYMKYHKIHTPVIVVTQFERFKADGTEVNVESLGKSLAEEFKDFFIEIIYFSHSDTVWQTSIHRILENINAHNPNR